MAACLCVKADTNSTGIGNAMFNLSKEAFKCGVIVGNGETLHALATNHLDVETIPSGDAMADEAWEKFVSNHMRKASINKAVVIQITNAFRTSGISAVRVTNEYVLSATNAPNTVHVQLSGELKTNWVTTSIESPVVAKGHEFDAVMRYDTLHQTGTVISNTLATFRWKDKPTTTVLESIELIHMKRTTPAMSAIINIQ